MEDRRTSERRQSLLAIRLPDRRLGFPRRQTSGPFRSQYLNMLTYLRDSPTTIVLLGSLLLALNLADLTLTKRALAAGAIELNPFMAAFFESDMAAANAVKLGMSAAVVGGLWSLRRYRPAISALVWATVMMGVLVTYQTALVIAIT